MDSLEYKYITGYNNKYCITRNGKVYITDYRGTGVMKEMKQRVIKGYYCLGLESPDSTSKNRKQKIHKVHRLLAEAFIPNPENKSCINHKDGNKLNNSIDNLEWVTVQENTRHAYANNLEYTFWTKELGLACINLIENYGYNHSDVQHLFNLPSRTYVYRFWTKGYKSFGLSHNNVFIPKHSRKKDIPESYRQYILDLIKNNTVLR